MAARRATMATLIGCLRCRRRVHRRGGRGWGAKQSPTEREVVGATAVGEPTEVANPDEAAGKDVAQEAPPVKLGEARGERHLGLDGAR